MKFYPYLCSGYNSIIHSAMKRKITKEEAMDRIKRLEWVQSEVRRCVTQGLPISTLKKKGIEVCNFNAAR